MEKEKWLITDIPDETKKVVETTEEHVKAYMSRQLFEKYRKDHSKEKLQGIQSFTGKFDAICVNLFTDKTVLTMCAETIPAMPEPIEGEEELESISATLREFDGELDGEDVAKVFAA